MFYVKEEIVAYVKETAIDYTKAYYSIEIYPVDSSSLDFYFSYVQVSQFIINIHVEEIIKKCQSLFRIRFAMTAKLILSFGVYRPQRIIMTR